MALNASSKLRPKVIALQKSGVAVILQRAEEAAEKGALSEKKARETYRTTVRVRTRHTADSNRNRFEAFSARTRRHPEVAFFMGLIGFTRA